MRITSHSVRRVCRAGLTAIAACILITASPPATAGPADASSSMRLVSQAEELYRLRHKDPANATRCRALLEQSVRLDSTNARAFAGLSRISYYFAEQSTVRGEQSAFYSQGVEFGKKAIRFDSTLESAHLWYLINLGRQVQRKGFLTALWAVAIIRREADLILALNPKNVEALNIRANMYLELPGFLGGDLRKAEETMHQAISLDPNFGLLHLGMAGIHIRQKKFAAAREDLRALLAIQKPTDEADHEMNDRPAAERLLEKIKYK